MKNMDKIIVASGALLLTVPTWGMAQVLEDDGVLAGGGVMENPGVIGDDTPLQEDVFAPETMDVSQYQELIGRDYVVKPYNVTLRDLEDAEVYGVEGDQLGEVERFLGDEMNNVVAVTVETEGFLGFGGEDVVVPLDQMQLEGDRFVTPLTEEQLKAMPRWRD